MLHENKISDSVSEQLENATQEALNKLDPFNQLMNAGVEYEKEQQEEQLDKPKRKRRTKAEMQAAREEADNIKSELPMNHEQFCEWEIEKAHLEGKEEPDFDYRKFYQEGDYIYLVRYYDLLKVKEIIYVKIRTIYARLMVGVVNEQYCQCIGITDRDNIFYNHQDALNHYNSIQASTMEEYNENNNKKKRKSNNTAEDNE